MPGARKDRVKRYGNNDSPQRRKKQYDNASDYSKKTQVNPAYGQDTSKEIRRKVGHKAWREETADNTNTHAKCPKQGYGGILPDSTASGNPLNSTCTRNSEQQSGKNGIDTEQNTKADAAKRGMSDTATDKH